MANEIADKIKELLAESMKLPVEERAKLLNEVRSELHKVSPFAEPVDLVQWVPVENVHANDYNPNKVAPPKMKLLELSIQKDGYTQPIVVYHDGENDRYIVVDGFHRKRVGTECKEIYDRIHGHLPVVVIDKSMAERISSTIRHNRARGTHGIAPMSKIVEELYFLGWSDKRIAIELGMEKDEVLRLKQFTGVGALFKDREYSKAWEGDEGQRHTDESM